MMNEAITRRKLLSAGTAAGNQCVGKQTIDIRSACRAARRAGDAFAS